MYRAIDVWKKNSDHSLIRYRCFQILETGKYCIQSADYCYFPLDIEKFKHHEKQFLELLAESPPDERDEPYESLEAAIKAHEQDFKNDY